MVNHAAFSPDGQTLATAAAFSPDGQTLATALVLMVNHAAFSPDGQTLATALVFASASPPEVEFRLDPSTSPHRPPPEKPHHCRSTRLITTPRRGKTLFDDAALVMKMRSKRIKRKTSLITFFYYHIAVWHLISFSHL